MMSYYNDIYTDSDGQVLKVRVSYHGFKEYINSKRQYHRLDGPAIIWHKGKSFNYKINNNNHRIGGPAKFYDDTNYCEWWVNNKQVSIYYICG